MGTQAQPKSQVIELVGASEVKPGRRWSPSVGEETIDLLKHLGLPKESANRVRDEAVQVLAHCPPPSGKAEGETGLAVGYVQSGKTMSFTTVAALARDNGYRIVIVIAGISKPLLAQSTERLARDLRINEGNRGWQLFESSLLLRGALPGAREQLKATLDSWKGEVALPFTWMRRTALIMVMKHAQHLDRVRALLQGLDLKRVPVLVIDDEADQASLNTAVRRQDESKTYARIKLLRDSLPHHAFLQYTATPQAPLLLSIIDSLSPRFVEVLTPGPDYVGGKDFFLSGGASLAREIPEEDLPGDKPLDSAPDSLLRAMQLFFIGAAAGFMEDKGKGNRSMLVHPSQRRTGHSEYYNWVMTTRGDWATILNRTSGYDDDRTELLKEFDSAYEDIATTVDQMPSKEEVLKALPWIVANTVVQEVNSRAGETPKVNWKSNYSHILVGGQAMDRGFTVEGLTVTYMPRSLGVGNADTVQQRARFFGYKRPYLGYCRVFLEQASIDAYRRYVAHEEDMRARLLTHRASGKPLSVWKRMFYLDRSLRPTRSSVLELDYFRTSNVVRDWFSTRSPHESPVTENRQAINALRASLKDVLRPDPGSQDRTEYQIHDVARVKLKTVFEDCLLRLRFTNPSDLQGFTVLQILFAEMLDRDAAQECALYVMSRGKARQRTVNGDGEIKNLFQGAAPSEPKSEVGRIYTGDRHMVATDVPTIQIHFLNIEQEDDKVLGTEVPTIAIHLPSAVVEDLLIQPQPHQGSADG